MRPSSIPFVAALIVSPVAAQTPLAPTDRESVEDEWYLRTKDRKAMLYVWEVGTGEPVIVVHGGFGAEHSYLFDVFRGLTDEFRLVFYDQRGSLRSRCEPEDISFKQHVADLDQLREELKLERVTLFGHSMGSVLTMQYLQEHPDRVKNVVLTGALKADNSYRSKRPEEELTKFRERPAIQAEMDKVRATGVTGGKLDSRLWRIQFAGANTFHVERWRQMKGGQAFYSQAAGTAAGKTLPEKWDFTEALGTHEFPVTVINGDHDFVDFGGEYWGIFAEETPEVDVVLLENAGHNAWIDAPKRFRAALLRGLSRKQGDR